MSEITNKIRNSMREKKSNLCISVDFTKCQKILDTLALVKDYIVMVKLHVDIIEDFSDDFIQKLVAVCEKNSIFILEDRKFADIGHIFQKQFVGGMYRIQSWCHLITMHSLIGQGALQSFEQCADLEKQGVLLIKQMSNSGNWLDEDYASRTLWLGRLYPNLVSGFIGQDKKNGVDTSFLLLTPGVNRTVIEDKLDQRYKTPQQAIKDGADIIIVGRGIIQAPDMKNEAEIYRRLAWQEYEKKTK